MPKGKNTDFPKGDFARAVIDLYHYGLNPATLPKRPNADDLQVRQVASALLYIKQLVDQAAQVRGDDLSANGRAEAVQLLEALTIGLSHPIHRFVEDIHTGKFRANQANPSTLETWRRAIVAGAVLAIQQTQMIKQAAALRVVCPALTSDDKPLGADAVRGWQRSFQEHENELPWIMGSLLIECAEAYGEIEGFPLQERILVAARSRLHRLFSTPIRGKAPFDPRKLALASTASASGAHREDHALREIVPPAEHSAGDD